MMQVMKYMLKILTSHIKYYLCQRTAHVEVEVQTIDRSVSSTDSILKNSNSKDETAIMYITGDISRRERGKFSS